MFFQGFAVAELALSALLEGAIRFLADYSHIDIDVGPCCAMSP